MLISVYILCRYNPINDYKIGNVLLEKVSEERELGVYLSDLKPSLQCVEVAKKASSALCIMKRTFPTSEMSSLLCYIRPMFAVTWNN